uniref:Putative regulatory associated protein of TOR n=1 Tax=Helianthus annuus TaxID=4232 RepID=A0A251TIW9_HELAN
MGLGLADPILHDHHASPPDPIFLPKSTIYNRSCTRFSKPFLTPAEDFPATRNERVKVALQRINKCQRYSGCNLHNAIARWDTHFQTGAQTLLLHPFSPFLIASDDAGGGGGCIRIWDYEEATLLNSFNNHESPGKEISKLCLVNEFVACDGNVRVWKDYTIKCKQKLVTAFSSIHGVTVRSVNPVVDWQQQSGYMYASGGISSTMVWDLNKEQLLSSIPLSSVCSISALAASQVHGGQFAAGFMDGSVRLYDIRTHKGLVCVTRPHALRVERVVGIGFQPGLYPAKIVSASQAGDIQFLDIRNQSEAYLTIDAHRGSLTAFAIHRHAPLVASNSAKQLIKVFNTEGEQLDTIRYSPNFMARKVGSATSLAFHPYQILLAAGSTDACVSIYADEVDA